MKIIKKYWLLYLIQILLIFLAIGGCLQKDRLILSLTGQDMMQVMEKEGEGSYYKSSLIKLSPGVYRIRVKASIPLDASMNVSLVCETSTYNALRCNGAAMFEGLEYMDIDAYVLDTIETAFLKCTLNKTDISSLIGMDITATNKGSKFFLFLTAAISILLNMFLSFREKILAAREEEDFQSTLGKMHISLKGGTAADKQMTVFWLLLFSIALLFLPYATNYFDLGKDTAFHLLRIEGLKETLLQGGQFPVRIQSSWLYDHGYAASTFFGDLFLLYPAFLRMIGFSMMGAYKIFVLTVMAATAVITYHSFMKCTRNTYGALFGTILYILSPYMIYTYYVTGEAGEYLAMAFLPLICSGIYQIFTWDIHAKSYGGAKIPLILGLTCIMQSHLPVFGITAVLILIVCTVLWKRTFRWETFRQLLQAAVITLLLNCWFWLPFLQMLMKDRYVLHDLVQSGIQSKGTQLSGLLQPFPSMGTAQNGMKCEIVIISTSALLMLLLFLVMEYRKHVNMKQSKAERKPLSTTELKSAEADMRGNVERKQLSTTELKSAEADMKGNTESCWDKLLMLLLAVIALTIFFSTRYFHWDLLVKIPGLGLLITTLVSPEQLLSLVSVMCAMFGAFFTAWLNIEASRYGKSLFKGILIFLTVVTIGSAVYQVNDIAFERSVIRLYTAENIGTINVGRGEFLIRGTQPDDYSNHKPVTEGSLEYTDYRKSGVNISIGVKNNSQTQLHLELPVTGYKGYRLESSEQGNLIPFITEERGAHGDLRISIPAGYEGTLNIEYAGFQSYGAAQFISLFTLISILLLQVYKRRQSCILLKK